MRLFTVPVVVVVLAATQASAVGQQPLPRFEQEIEVIASRDRGSSRQDYVLTFDAPFALPRVSLPPGQYRFELPTAKVVRVSAADRSTAYDMFHTTRVTRTHAALNHIVVLGQAGPGEVQPITAWFPPGQRTGYRFPTRGQ